MSYYRLTFQPGVTRRPKPVSMIRVEPTDAAAPRKAVEVVRAGGLVVFPTDEGYYVGCDALNAGAVERLRKVTGAAPDQIAQFAASGDQARRLEGVVRTPTHLVAVALMRDAGTPLAAATAPAGSRPAPTAQQVIFAVGDGVDLVLDAGRILRVPAAA